MIVNARLATTFLGETALFPFRSVTEPVLHAARQFLALAKAPREAFNVFLVRVVPMAHRLQSAS